MPVNPASITPITLTPTGGSTGSITGATSVITVAIASVFPVQVCGFVPLTDCSLSECRKFFGDCYLNPVFGTVGINLSTYENDLSTFFIDDAMRRVTLFKIQKLNNSLGTWSDIATIGSSLPGTFPYITTYGTFYNYGHFTGHSNYIGVQINWGHVLALNGTGIYRLMVTSPTVIDSRHKPFPYCLVSEAFNLMAFNCNRANHTVKWEANNSGMIGSHKSDTNVFDLCNISLYDSIRVNGIIREVSPTKIDEYLEYQTGIMDLVNAKLVLKYLWESEMLPEYIYKRLMVYGGLSGNLWVSDYNLSNTRYDIKLLPIIMKSLEIDPNKANRQTPVKIHCESGIQSIIKSTSCNLIH